MTLRHAQQRCGRVIIMSAKYGLLELQDPVSWYEAYLPALSAEDRASLLVRLRKQALEKLAGERVLWYPSTAYWDAFAEAAPELAKSVSRPYHKLSALMLRKVLSKEIKNYGFIPSRR
jgi:hypothetical protein